jgi:hypothetical protein
MTAVSDPPGVHELPFGVCVAEDIRKAQWFENVRI